MFLKCPRTQVTIMCRHRNSAALCPGSKSHCMVTPSSSPPTAEVTNSIHRRRQLQSLVRYSYSQRRTDALYRRYSSPNFCAKYLSSLAITPYQTTISVGISIPRSHALLTQTAIPM